MVLTKEELIASLKNEVGILLHLASKIDPAKLDFRPTAKQRSTLELMQYLTMMAPIHARAVMAPAFDAEEWGREWTTREAAAKSMDLEQAKEAIRKQPEMLAELLQSCSDADLRAPIEMFGGKASRGSMFVNLVLCHYVAYRMQLFIYLKASGRDELGTMNLWAGRDTF